MGKIEKLSVVLTQQQAEALREAVREGAFASTSEAVRSAVQDWADRRSERAITAIQRIRDLWEEGLASGEPRPARPVAEIIASARKRLADRS